jgi:phosphoacetylglucosamine mutase
VQVVNPAVGDAMSNILLVVAILKRWHMKPSEWVAMFHPRSSKLAAMRVADRYAIKTAFMETRVAEPAMLQMDIDAAVATVSGGRSFVRPSGTEDVVRVYTEADSQDACDQLCLRVLQLVHRHAAGLGPMPVDLP